MSQMNGRETIVRLQELIRRHQVCYEVWPENLVVNGQLIKVGFVLELEGTHEHPGSEVQPGCQQCQEVFRALQRIAEWIMPTEARPTTYEIQPFDRALRYAPKRKRRPEVSLTIKVIHRQGFDQPVDECEELCLREMRLKLAELGVLEGGINSSELPHTGGVVS